MKIKNISKVENKLTNLVKNQFLLEHLISLKERIDLLEVENKKLLDKEEYINNKKKNRATGKNNSKGNIYNSPGN